MSQPVAPIDICNLALDRIGQAPISSIESPVTTNELICARHYDQNRRELLRSYILNFSKKYVELAADAAATPVFGYSNAYLKPNDLLRIRALGDHTVNDDLVTRDYDLVGKYIYTDYGDTSGLKLSYTFDETLVVNWDPLFVKAAVLGLAMAMAYKFTLKPSVVTRVENEFEKAEMRAKAVAGQENPPRRIERSKMRTARRMGSIYRDNRFV